MAWFSCLIALLIVLCSSGHDIYVPAGGAVGLAAHVRVDGATQLSVEPLHPVARFLQETIDQVDGVDMLHVYVKEPIQLADDCVHAADLKLNAGEEVISMFVARASGLRLEATAQSTVVGNVISVAAVPTVRIRGRLAVDNAGEAAPFTARAPCDMQTAAGQLPI